MVSGLESSLWYSIAAVSLACLAGGSLALAERLWQQPRQRWFTAVMMLPVFLPPVVVTTSFIATFGKAGVLPLNILYSPLAIVMAYWYYNFPLAYLLLRGAISRISAASEAAAQTLGANRWQRLITVFLPHLRLPLVGTVGIIFLYCFTSFIVPLQLGGVHGGTLEVWLYQQIYVYHNYATALIAALLQSAVAAGIVLIIALVLPKITVSKVTPEQSGKTQPIFRLIRVVITAIVIGPLLGWLFRLLSSVSLSDVVTVMHSNFIPALIRTLIVAAGVTAVAIGLVLVVHIGTKTALMLLALSPVVLSFMWYQGFGQSYLSLGSALLMSLLPFTALLIHHARAQSSHYLMPTASLLGANWWQRARLELSLLKPTLRQTAVFGCILVIGDATITSALAPTGHPLAMPYALQLISSYRFPVGSLVIVIIMLTIASIVTLAYARRS